MPTVAPSGGPNGLPVLGYGEGIAQRRWSGLK